jgi:outer membrane protein OmpA-like peptidoglycan-associated protein
MKTIVALGLLFAVTTSVGAAGCATVPPSELVNARDAYNRASQGPAAQLNPTDLHVAKQKLDIAERSFADKGDVMETKDAAYSAERLAQIAEVRARTIALNKQKEQIVGQMNASQTSTLQTTSAALGRSNSELAAKGQQLTDERQRREDAEKRAAQAAADLAQVASVKQESRGLVITLSGSVLFASGKSTLLPAAQTKLGDVASALTKQDPDSKIVVEGHTDSQGGEAMNQELSQKRAEAVRSFLVGRGISADRVTAQGFGPSRSVADNKSAEGRANNRRVEIVVQPGTASP